jgi:hypothetical protein
MSERTPQWPNLISNGQVGELNRCVNYLGQLFHFFLALDSHQTSHNGSAAFHDLYIHAVCHNEAAADDIVHNKLILWFKVLKPKISTPNLKYPAKSTN